MTNHWTEVEDFFLSNQPMIARGGARIPDPEVEPTEFYLFTFDCRRMKRGVRRKRRLEVLKAETVEELELKLLDLTMRDDVIVIESQDNPGRYQSYRGEPTPIEAMGEVAGLGHE